MSKRTHILSLAYAAAASVACGGHCYYSAALQPALTPQDLVFDSTLLGSWIAGAGSDTTLFVLERPDTSRWYKLSIISVPDTDVDQAVPDTEVYRVGVGRFDDAWIADVYPSDDWTPRGYVFHVIPVHQIVRLWVSRDSLRYADLSYDWLDRMIALNRQPVPHQHLELDNGCSHLYLLTGSTRQLQELLHGHATDTSAFSDKTELRRAPGRKSP